MTAYCTRSGWPVHAKWPTPLSRPFATSLAPSCRLPPQRGTIDPPRRITMRRSLLLFAATLSLSFAPAPLPKFQRPPRAAAIAPLEGRWDGVQWLLVTPTRLTYHAGQASQGYDLRFNPRARPATYDLREDG